MLLAALLAGCAAPQAPGTEPVAEAPQAEPAARAGVTLPRPMLIPPGSPLAAPAAARGAQAAPTPDRKVEAPAAPGPDPLALRLEPTLIRPDAQRPRGYTFGSEHAPDREGNRLFLDVLPGARLRIPIE